MYRNLPKGLISKLENPNLEFYFYFPLNTQEIIQKIETDISPLKFSYNQDQVESTTSKILNITNYV